MRDGYQVWFKQGEHSVYREQGKPYDTIEAARTAVADAEGYSELADAASWALSASGNYISPSYAAGFHPWMIQPVRVPETDTDRIQLAAELGFEFGQTDGGHHKVWVIDQMLRTLLGDGYDAAVAAYRVGEDGPDTYTWDTGIAP